MSGRLRMASELTPSTQLECGDRSRGDSMDATSGLRGSERERESRKHSVGSCRNGLPTLRLVGGVQRLLLSESDACSRERNSSWRLRPFSRTTGTGILVRVRLPLFEYLVPTTSPFKNSSLQACALLLSLAVLL